jgi:hypothetical protein
MLLMSIRLGFDTVCTRYERRSALQCWLVAQMDISVHIFARSLPCTSESREVRTAYYF